jgi:hypothetical protein
MKTLAVTALALLAASLAVPWAYWNPSGNNIDYYTLTSSQAYTPFIFLMAGGITLAFARGLRGKLTRKAALVGAAFCFPAALLMAHQALVFVQKDWLPFGYFLQVVSLVVFLIVAVSANRRAVP